MTGDIDKRVKTMRLINELNERIKKKKEKNGNKAPRSRCSLSIEQLFNGTNKPKVPLVDFWV